MFLYTLSFILSDEKHSISILCHAKNKRSFIKSFKWHERSSENVHCLQRCQERFIRALGIVCTQECLDIALVTFRLSDK